VLAVFCTAAMLSDGYWTRRARRRRDPSEEISSPDTSHQTPDTLPS
jgi:hypothetical protein